MLYQERLEGLTPFEIGDQAIKKVLFGLLTWRPWLFNMHCTRPVQSLLWLHVSLVYFLLTHLSVAALISYNFLCVQHQIRLFPSTLFCSRVPSFTLTTSASTRVEILSIWYVSVLDQFKQMTRYYACASFASFCSLADTRSPYERF